MFFYCCIFNYSVYNKNCGFKAQFVALPRANKQITPPHFLFSFICHESFSVTQAYYHHANFKHRDVLAKTWHLCQVKTIPRSSLVDRNEVSHRPKW